MNITITRNGRQFGPYTFDQTNLYLALGRLSGAELASQEGVSQWVPLSSIPGVVMPPPAPRSLGRLILMTLVWSAAFWFGSLLIAGAIAGALHPAEATKAGREIGESLSGVFLLLSMLVSIRLTTAGVLPGTAKH
jgi:hypothetical protein